MRNCIIIILGLLIACKPVSVKSIPTAESNAAPIINEIPSDSVLMIMQIRGFILWYKENYHKVNDIKFTSTNSKGFYEVNLDECSKYMSRLIASGYLSQEYSKAWTKYFDSQVLNFRDNPMSEGPPEGFDYDLVFITQEPELIWNALENLQFKISKNEDGKTVVNVATEKHDLDYRFEMGKENDIWKIDYISTENYD